MIFVEFIVKVFAGHDEFTELKPGEINFTWWLIEVRRALNVNGWILVLVVKC
jgi:hypothetical protein